MVSLEDLFNTHGLDVVDFMKMDIEGSEYALFENPLWLKRVNALSMEIHPDHGDPGHVFRTLEEHGFTCIAADENLQRLPEATSQSSVIYARKTAV